ncbi:MAG: leader peptide processing enzyme [Treponema sp.]|nr:leader peptide processing enzyme [Treponema sp.]
MNKKVNTLLFILGATLFNVIVAVISFILLLIFYASFIAPIVPGSQAWAVSLLFLAAIAVSIFVYRIVLKALLAKVDVEKYFDPLFVRRPGKKPGSSA